MAKLDKVSTIKIMDTQQNTELVYNATTEPKKSTLGNSYFGTLNSKGIAKLQSLGHNVTDETSWCNLLRTTFGLTEDELGDRGVKWDTIEARQRYKIFIDNVAFEPAFTAKQKARLNEVEQIIPKVPSNVGQAVVPEAVVPQAVIPPMEVPADTLQVQIPKPVVPQAIVPQAVVPTFEQAVVPEAIIPPSAEELAYVEKMKNAISTGKWTKEQLITSLGEKIGVDKATRVYALAV